MTAADDAAFNGSPTHAAATASTTTPPVDNTSTDPELSDRIHIHRSPHPFRSGAHSKVSLPAGSLFACITTATPAAQAYTTLQVGETTHVELNSALVFCNHSCAPSLDFDTASMEVRVVAGSDLRPGDPLTFFYPSTEWVMAQPFDCTCGAGDGICLAVVSGARDVRPEVLRRYWINKHIEHLLRAREMAGEWLKEGKAGDNAVDLAVGGAAAKIGLERCARAEDWES